MGKPTLFIAAGHGGTDRGNVSTQYVEAACTKAFVDSMRAWTHAQRIPLGLGGVVFLSHELDLAGQIEYMEQAGASLSDGDWGVDIHFDYAASPKRRGAMAIADTSIIAREAARQFLVEWQLQTGIPNNGVADSKTWAQRSRRWGPGSDMGWCRPAIWGGTILELGFLSSAADMMILLQAHVPGIAMDILWNSWLRVRDARS